MNSKELALEARISTLKMTSSANASHVASGLSVIDILAVLYSGVAKVSPMSVDDPLRDRIIISKGHAAAAVYSILAHAGYISPELLDSYCQDGALLGGHVTSHGVRGVEFSTGSLGHGLPLGVGVALSHKRANHQCDVFVVTSDGELDEGTIWESALLAAHHKLGNLKLIVDRNGLQSLTTTEETLALEPLDKKFESFGWNVLSIDGHNHSELIDSITRKFDVPTAIIARTTKGKGVSFMENEVLWHYRPASPELLSDAIAELRNASLT